MSATTADKSLRPRHRNVADLEKLFLQYSSRPNWWQYPEKMDARTRSDLLVVQKDFVKSSVEALPRLVICQSDATEALLYVDKIKREEQPEQWSLPSNEVKTWAEAMSWRIRVLYRHVSQARCRAKREGYSQVLWLKMLNLPEWFLNDDPNPQVAAYDAIKDEGGALAVKGPAGDGVAPPKAEIHEDAPEVEARELVPAGDGVAPKVEASTAPAPKFGFIRKTLTAWMRPHGEGKSFTVDIQIPEGADPLDPPIAMFDNGTEWCISGYTVEEHQAKIGGHDLPVVHSHRKKKPAASIGGNTLWTSGSSRGNLRIAWRKDRGDDPWLISLFRQEVHKWRQVCSVRISQVRKHGTLEEVDRVEVVDKMKVIMQKIGENFASNEIEEFWLYHHRDIFMTEAGLEMLVEGPGRKKQNEGGGSPAAVPAEEKVEEDSDEDGEEEEMEQDPETGDEEDEEEKEKAAEEVTPGPASGRAQKKFKVGVAKEAFAVRKRPAAASSAASSGDQQARQRHKTQHPASSTFSEIIFFTRARQGQVYHFSFDLDLASYNTAVPL